MSLSYTAVFNSVAFFCAISNAVFIFFKSSSSMFAHAGKVVLSTAFNPEYCAMVCSLTGFSNALIHSIAFFIGCMFVDPIVVILVLVPIFSPVVDSVGLDPVLVGVIITLQVAIGSATPPFGCDIFTAIAVFKRPYIDVIRGTPPFVFMLILSAALLIIFPEIALFLRDLAFK